MNQPYRHLPIRLQRYIGYPVGLVLGWLFLCGLLLNGNLDALIPNNGGNYRQTTGLEGTEGSYSSPESNSVASSSVESSAVTLAATMSGSLSLALSRKEGGYTVSQGNLAGSEIVFNAYPDECHFYNVQHLVSARTSAPDAEGAIRIYDVKGALVYTYSPADEGFKIRNASNITVFRVKIKEDKFNLYGGEERRLLRGKFKGSSIVLKDESDEKVAEISLPLVTDAENAYLFAGILSLPIAEEYRLLLFAAVSR